MEIAIIIPAYNEELTIKDVIKQFHKELPKAKIFIIDNNSKDKTNEIARETLHTLKNKGSVLFEKKQGKANAVRKAFHEIDADIYIMVDADLTYSAKDVHMLIEPVINGSVDIVVGDRLTKGLYSAENKRKFHDFGNNLVKNLINYIFKADLLDIMSGYRVFNRKFVKNYPILVEGFELETDMTIHTLDKKFSIMEIPIDYQDRPSGSESKLNTFSDGFKVIKTIFALFMGYRPFNFFAFISSIFLLGSLVAGAPVIIEFFKTRYIAHVPLAILATGLMILAVLSFSIGIILHNIITHHKFNFEHNLLLDQARNKRR